MTVDFKAREGGAVNIEMLAGAVKHTLRPAAAHPAHRDVASQRFRRLEAQIYEQGLEFRTGCLARVLMLLEVLQEVRDPLRRVRDSSSLFMDNASIHIDGAAPPRAISGSSQDAVPARAAHKYDGAQVPDASLVVNVCNDPFFVLAESI